MSNQPTLECVLEKKKIWDINDPRADKVSRAIMNTMAKDAEPFRLVEREGFKDLIGLLAPSYVLPSRTYFSRTLMPKMYDEKRSSIAEQE